MSARFVSAHANNLLLFGDLTCSAAFPIFAIAPGRSPWRSNNFASRIRQSKSFLSSIWAKDLFARERSPNSIDTSHCIRNEVNLSSPIWKAVSIYSLACRNLCWVMQLAANALYTEELPILISGLAKRYRLSLL